MQCKEFEAVLEQDGLSPLLPNAREHLASCAVCQDFLADLSAVVVAAKSIPAEVTPPDRIWISIRAQLEAEGIIRDPQSVVVPSSEPWWHGFSQFFGPRALATVVAALFLVLGSIYFVKRPHTNDTAEVSKPSQTQASESPKTVAPAPVPSNSVAPRRNSVPPSLSAGSHQPSRSRASTGELKPSPSESAYLGEIAAGLSQTENALPQRELADNAMVDASLRQNLRTLNGFIAECEARLKRNPQDQLTREYLNMAYQQKAELLTAMMDSGRSEN
ncbi:MAG: hypothetical protein WBL63_08355 [Candidatus Acidiferrum sp.]